MANANVNGNGSSGDSLGGARAHLAAAFRLAGPAMTAGDHHGCYEVFACAARLILAEGADRAVEQRLEQALQEGQVSPDPAGKVTPLWHTFEDLLGGALAEVEGPPPPSADPLARMQQAIETAISVGAPAYNAGDHRGCYEVYACTARALLAAPGGPAEARDRLRRALDQCATLSDPNQQAWAMRHGFDDVLSMTPPTPEPEGPAEMVPVYLKMAIQIGAPAYNAGDHRGCYEVYACTARLILGTIGGVASAKALLRDALQRCCLLADATEQAWVMRRAFDAILVGTKGNPEGPAS